MFILRCASERHAQHIAVDLKDAGFPVSNDGSNVYVDSGLDRLDDVLLFVVGSDISYYRYVNDIIPVFGRAKDITAGIGGLAPLLAGKKVLIRIRPASTRDELLPTAIAAIEEADGVPETKGYELVLYVLKEGKEFTIGLIDAEREQLLRDARANESAHISRAYYKIQEAFARKPYALKGKTVVDIGAAPGGWSEYLVERGARVVAVDPADLDQQLERRVAHLKMDARDEETAKMVKRITGAIDVLVCDVNADPRDVARTLSTLYIPMMRTHGRLVMTVKYTRPGRRARDRMMNATRKMLEDAGIQILWADQLLANTKNEATIIGEKK